MIGEKVYRMSWGTRVGISLVHASSVSLLAVFRVAQVSRRVMAVSRAEVRLKLVPLTKHLSFIWEVVTRASQATIYLFHWSFLSQQMHCSCPCLVNSHWLSNQGLCSPILKWLSIDQTRAGSLHPNSCLCSPFLPYLGFWRTERYSFPRLAMWTEIPPIVFVYPNVQKVHSN